MRLSHAVKAFLIKQANSILYCLTKERNEHILLLGESGASANKTHHVESSPCSCEILNMLESNLQRFLKEPNTHYRCMICEYPKGHTYTFWREQTAYKALLWLLTKFDSKRYMKENGFLLHDCKSSSTGTNLKKTGVLQRLWWFKYCQVWKYVSLPKYREVCAEHKYEQLNTEATKKAARLANNRRYNPILRLIRREKQAHLAVGSDNYQLLDMLKSAIRTKKSDFTKLDAFDLLDFPSKGMKDNDESPSTKKKLRRMAVDMFVHIFNPRLYLDGKGYELQECARSVGTVKYHTGVIQRLWWMCFQHVHHYSGLTQQNNTLRVQRAGMTRMAKIVHHAQHLAIHSGDTSSSVPVKQSNKQQFNEQPCDIDYILCGCVKHRESSLLRLNQMRDRDRCEPGENVLGICTMSSQA